MARVLYGKLRGLCAFYRGLYYYDDENKQQPLDLFFSFVHACFLGVNI